MSNYKFESVIAVATLAVVATVGGIVGWFVHTPSNSDLACQYQRLVIGHPADSRAFIDIGEVQICISGAEFPGTHTLPIYQQTRQSTD